MTDLLIETVPLYIPNSIVVIAGDYTRSTINKVIATKIETYATHVYRLLSDKYPQYTSTELLDVLHISLLLNKEKILSRFCAEDREIATLFLSSIQPISKSNL